MTNLGNEIESDSSDEEWVISSTIGTPKIVKKPYESKKDKQRLTISSAAIRTIKASLPSSTLPPFKPNKHPVHTPTISMASPVSTASPSPSLQYISDEELVAICTEMNSRLLVSRLIQVYKSCEIYFRIREIETPSSVIEVRLKNHLHLCLNPCDFVIVKVILLSSRNIYSDYLFRTP